MKRPTFLNFANINVQDKENAMKKTLLTIAITSMLTFTALFGGCGFSGSDSKVIDKITPVYNAEKGVTEITITYVDDLYSPDHFEIPDGKQGAIGYSGNGIASIEQTEKFNESTGTTQRYMLIKYTDGSTFELPIYDGANGVDGTNGNDGDGITNISAQQNIDGTMSIIVEYNNGKKTTAIPVPNGKNGDKISISSQYNPEDGSTKLTFTVTDHWNIKTTQEFTIPKGEKGNSVEYILGETSADGKQYVLKIKIENVDELQEITFNRPNALLTGSKNPIDDENGVKGDGLDGDLYYNTVTNVFYVKANGVWTSTLDLSSSLTYKVKFEASAWLGSEKVNVQVTPTNLFSGLKQGTFYSNGKAGSVPTPILPDEYASLYEFIGWYTTSDPNFSTQSPFTDLTYIASDMTLYPIFIAK